jgi:glutaredoxin
VKEFLSQQGVDFAAVDIVNDHEGRERLLELGVRTVPIVAKDGRFVFGQNLDTVTEFLGLRRTAHVLLPPNVLIEKWINVLRAGQRYVRQMPIELMDERALKARDRTIRVLSHHFFRIAEAFLECAVDGVEYTIGIADREPHPGRCTTGDDIVRYGDEVIERLRDWWKAVPDRACRQNVQTFYGSQSVHELLERSTWHCAQHGRQLIDVLHRYSIDPDGPLVAEDLSGLPLPEGLFE